MKVFPMLIKEQTFSLSELVTAVELLHDQLTLKAAHSQADPEADLPEQAQIQHGGVSQGDKVQSAWTSVSSLSSLNTTIDVGPAGDTAANTVVPNATPGTVTPGTATPAIATTTAHGSTSASARWYVITVRRETGVFQGWHNVHSHVIGVPGACFGWYSSHASADEAYAQALQDGTVQELPV
ncbi:uncharacterized protein EDB91DRAFT_1079859 [Suillus paluster]|uniref:uncharacterized protein n=1 Tax=Suillus paluster TaxID=48578 RepID=UPI001B8826E3|nr:uncharacterized protein EDB91DRAFT_1079859 [Suillus paluster]KAG1747265.1 hypothetical protein EDB91DRAFT_1079859 [Suillus paluster]